MFDFDAVKALLGDDRSFALEILVSDLHPNPRATRSPRLARAFAPNRAPWRIWLELRRLPPIMGFVGSGPGLVTVLA